MKARFFTSVRNLRISENLGQGDKFGDLRVTNDPSVIKDLIPQSSFSSIGQLELTALCDGSAVFYRVFDLERGANPQDVLIFHVALVQTFHTALWMDRDEAPNTEMSYLCYEVGQHGKIDSNFLGVHFTNSRGESQPVTLSRIELRAIRDRGVKLFDSPSMPLKSSTRLTSSSPRLSRALYFINGARSVNDLSIKVAHYCTGFETLLSTSHTELAHQLSERVSFLLATSTDARVEIYRNMKEAYGFRSKVVHGAAISEKQVSRLAEISTFCDTYARKLFDLALACPDVGELFESGPEKFDSRISTWVLQDSYLRSRQERSQQT